MSTQNSSPLAQLDEKLELYLVKKAPALPEKIKEVIVKYGPWITLVLLVLSLPALLAVFSIGALVAPVSFLGGPNAGFQYIISMVVSVVSLVFEGLAIPGLLKRTKQGWSFMFYSVLVGIVSSVISLNLGGILLGGLVPLYFLYQVKSYYK